MVQASAKGKALKDVTLCVCSGSAACTVAPHLAGALAANAAREGAEVKGAVNAANGHRRRHGLPWLTFVEIDIRECQAGRAALPPPFHAHKPWRAIRRGVEPQASDSAV